MKKPPVLIIAFNRPDKVRGLVEALRPAHPEEICISIDGPRASNPTDQERIAAVKAAFRAIDWQCSVAFNELRANAGCDKHVESAIDWFFSLHDSGIILEDDCAPSKDFFDFAADLLERYRDDRRVMAIDGTRIGSVLPSETSERDDPKASYYFSDYFLPWGWATWKRAWDLYDTRILDAEAALERKPSLSAAEMIYWRRYFGKYVSGSYINWDCKWLHAIWANGGVCISPYANLILNSGFGSDATHTFTKNPSVPRVYGRLGKMRHPDSVGVDRVADLATFRSYFQRSVWQKILYKLSSLKRRP